MQLLVVTVFTLLQWLWSQPWLSSSNGGDVPRDVNVAIEIAKVASETQHPRQWAAALDTWAAFETAYEDRPGDCPGLPVGSRKCTRALGAKSCGYWQTPCKSTPPGMSIEDQARQALAMMMQSAKACPSAVMSVYATGRCAPHSGPIAFRMGKIRKMMAVPLPSSDP